MYYVAQHAYTVQQPKKKEFSRQLYKKDGFMFIVKQHKNTLFQNVSKEKKQHRKKKKKKKKKKTKQNKKKKKKKKKQKLKTTLLITLYEHLPQTWLHAFAGFVENKCTWLV